MAQTKWRSNHSRHQPSVDKGWAWVILAAVFTERLLASTVYLSGIYNVVFLEEFGMSKSLTAWCGAVHISMMSLTGIHGNNCILCKVLCQLLFKIKYINIILYSSTWLIIPFFICANMSHQVASTGTSEK